jgi:tRNA1Val (adenine37-N6)-methyltransferase
MLYPNETIEKLCRVNLHVIQAKNGYRFSLDPVLLSHFAEIPTGSKVADLGTGCGIIPLLLSKPDRTRTIVGIERQAAMVGRALRSVTLNKLDEQIEIVQADIRQLPERFARECFDVVVSNPPYYPAGSGKLPADEERNFARHELAGGLVDFLRAAHTLLKPGGCFYIVFVADRLPELLAEMCCLSLTPKRMRSVHSRDGAPARMVLVEGRKDGRAGMVVDAPLVVYAGPGRDYSEEVLAMYGKAVIRDDEAVMMRP